MYLTDREVIFKQNDFLLNAVPIQVDTKMLIPTQRTTTDGAQSLVMAAKAPLSPHLQKVVSHFPDHLTPVQRKVTKLLVVKNGSLFSANEFDIGRTSLVQHEIDMGMPAHLSRRSGGMQWPMSP